MRLAKKRKALGHDVAPHVVEHIQECNRDHAVRPQDLIDLSQRAPLKVRGKGTYRTWLPEAMQRAAWGLRPRHRTLKRKPRPVQLLRRLSKNSHRRRQHPPRPLHDPWLCITGVGTHKCRQFEMRWHAASWKSRNRSLKRCLSRNMDSCRLHWMRLK